MALYNEYNFKIKDFIDKNQMRTEITGVFVSPKETCATDSFKLIKVSRAGGDVKDYPAIPNKPKAKSNFNAFILPGDKASDVLKLFSGSKNLSSSILENAVVLKRDKDFVEIGRTDLESYNSVLSKIIEGEFPSKAETAGQELAELVIKLAGLHEERRQQAQMYREEIKKLDLKIQELSIKIKTNQEDIPF